MHRYALSALAFGALVAGPACGGSSGGYDGPTNPGGSTGRVGATITIRSDGTVEPSEVRIAVGERVRFVNQDARQHQPTSNPHLSHTDCPPANLPALSTGQGENTGIFERVSVCNFHDHINPDTASLQGTIRVGGAEGPGGPVYVKQ